MYHMYCSWNCNDNEVTNNTECNDDQVSLTFQISRILAMSPASDNWVTLYCWWGWSGCTRLFKARRASSHTLSTADSQTRHDNRTLITICTSQSTAECSCLMSYDRRDSVKWTIASVTDALINTWQHKPHVYHKHTHAWNWVIMFYTVLKYTYMHTYMHKSHWFLFLELLQVRLNLWELMNRCGGGCPPSTTQQHPSNKRCITNMKCFRLWPTKLLLAQYYFPPNQNMKTRPYNQMWKLHQIPVAKVKPTDISQDGSLALWGTVSAGPIYPPRHWGLINVGPLYCSQRRGNELGGVV